MTIYFYADLVDLLLARMLDGSLGRVPSGYDKMFVEIRLIFLRYILKYWLLSFCASTFDYLDGGLPSLGFDLAMYFF